MAMATGQILSAALLAVLACPECKGSKGLDADPQRGELRCRYCSHVYPVVDGIPVMLADASTRHQRGQREFFDSQFDEYATYRLENWRQSYLRRIFDALRIEPEGRGRFLDVGVGGSGYTVIEAARLGWEAVGCDLSLPGMRKAAAFAGEQGVAERAHFVVCSAEKLPFAGAAFDAASEIAVLEHLERDDLGAGELARVLRGGGRFFVTVPHLFLRTHVLFWVPYYLHDRRHGHLRHYSAKSLARLFQDHCTELQPSYSGRIYKGLQMLAARLQPQRDDWWWALERTDLKNPGSPWGAMLHMSGTHRHPTTAPVHAPGSASARAV